MIIDSHDAYYELETDEDKEEIADFSPKRDVITGKIIINTDPLNKKNQNFREIDEEFNPLGYY